MAAIRTQSCSAHLYPCHFQMIDRRFEVGDFESEVKDASRARFRRSIGEAGKRRLVVLQDQMNLRVPRLKPEPRKAEARPLDPPHPEQVHIKRGTALETVDDERHVVDG